METKKIALACFLGGVICCGVALLLAPKFWWLGLSAGFASGYLSYDFKVVPKATFVRFYTVVYACAHEFGVASSVVWMDVKKWFSESHPFVYASVLVSAVIGYHWPIPVFFADVPGPGIVLFILQTAPGVVLSLGLIAELVFVPIVTTAWLGARFGERSYWWPFLLPGGKAEDEKEVENLERIGLRRESLTYTNVARWFVKGMWVIVIFFVWTLSKYLTIAVWTALRFVGRSTWRQFVQMHSRKSLLCGIDGMLGGFTSYSFFGMWATSTPETVLVVFSGGVFGTALGVLHWKLSQSWVSA